MSAKKVISERTAALLEKQRQLDERIKRSMQRDRSVSRRARNRALLLIGVAVEMHIKRHASYATTVRSFLPGLRDHEQEAVINFLDTLLAGDSTSTSADVGVASQSVPVPVSRTSAQENGYA